MCSTGFLNTLGRQGMRKKTNVHFHIRNWSHRYIKTKLQVTEGCKSNYLQQHFRLYSRFINWDKNKKHFLILSAESMLVHVQHLGFANILSNAGTTCRCDHPALLNSSFFLKKINSNLAKSDSWSAERKYFVEISESFSCILTGTGLGVTHLTPPH